MSMGMDTSTGTDTGTGEGVSAGKLRGLMTLADDDGVFRMLAVDQRPPLFAALTRHDGRDPGELSFEEVARAKGLLTRVLAPEAGAIPIDRRPRRLYPRRLPSC